LSKRKANWLLNAAQTMAEAMEKDWREWKKHWQS
jgi:hypothetical protein